MLDELIDEPVKLLAIYFIVGASLGRKSDYELFYVIYILHKNISSQEIYNQYGISNSSRWKSEIKYMLEVLTLDKEYNKERFNAIFNFQIKKYAMLR